tara:strand:+ start:66 stop:248 length:183 start_codon:yes stop_codon:yes gene_type:complete
MPKSKHRKNQKKKARQRTERIRAEKKKQMNQFMEMMRQQEMEKPLPNTAAPKNPYNIAED